MNSELLAVLVCPRCKGPLAYRSDTQELVCRHERLAYPVRNGIPVLLLMDARRLAVSETEDEQSG